MKIKWINGKKIIPKIGEINTGDIRDLPDDMAVAFINQGQARKYIEKKPKKEGGDK